MTGALDRLNAAMQGRYRLQRELGEGGMATVYLAEDLRHRRRASYDVSPDGQLFAVRMTPTDPTAVLVQNWRALLR